MLAPTSEAMLELEMTRPFLEITIPVESAVACAPIESGAIVITKANAQRARRCMLIVISPSNGTGTRRPRSLDALRVRRTLRCPKLSRSSHARARQDPSLLAGHSLLSAVGRCASRASATKWCRRSGAARVGASGLLSDRDRELPSNLPRWQAGRLRADLSG